MSFYMSMITNGSFAFFPKLLNGICDVICIHDCQRHHWLKKERKGEEDYIIRKKERSENNDFLKINKKIIIKDYFSNVLNKKENHLPWLVWFSGLSATLQTKGSLVRFPARTHAWVAGQVPSRGHMSGNHTLMFLSLSSFLPLSLKINKSNIFINLKKKENHLCRPKRFETLPLPLEKFIND